MSQSLASQVDGPVRAAQYLRMSSDNQRYSTENQQNAISEYAEEHGYDVVASYTDAGKSGLSLKGRDALKQLLSDALKTPRPFDAILVLDVSRWGRFQNPDQAAHYEFLCRQAGVRVVYVSEPFGEDVAPITTIIKHLKRVMAGEYSRELSVKLRRAQSQQARLGFKQGGQTIFGFRRLLVDPMGNPRQILKPGETKALDVDKVLIIPGPPEELAVVRRIFKLYVSRHLSVQEIVGRLAKAGVKNQRGRPLRLSAVRRILSSELCIGRMTYNVTTQAMQTPRRMNPQEVWTRFSAFDPIVPLTQFRKAQELLSRSARPKWDKESIIKALQSVLARKGRLSQIVINEAKDAPSTETVINRFGSLTAAYAAVGYNPPPRPAFGMNGRHWSEKALLSGLRKVYATHGYVSGHLLNCSPDLPSSSYIREYFGSMAEAIRRAGLPACDHSEQQRRSWKRRKAAGCDDCYAGVHWSDAALLRALRELHEQHGYTTGNLIDQCGVTPSAYYYVKRFGSLTTARALAHLPLLTRSQMVSTGRKRGRDGNLISRGPRHTGQRTHLIYRSDDILRGLRSLAEKWGVISSRLIDGDPNLPSAAAVVNHFGKLSTAYQLVGIVRLEGKPIRFGLPGCK